MKSLNISKFKKVEDNEHFATLKSEEGHEIRIAKAPLHPNHRKQLESLPMLAGGTPDAPIGTAQDVDLDIPETATPVDITGQGGDLPANLINPNPGAASMAANPQPEVTQPGADPSALPYGVTPEAVSTPKVEAAPAAATPTQTPDEEPVSTQPQPAADPYGNDAYSSSLMKGINEQKAGIGAEARAQAAQGQQEAAQLQGAIQKQQDIVSHFDKESAVLTKERQAVQEDIKNQHIDPNHYLNSMGTGQRIQTAIGLILGGFAAGAGQANPAQQFLNEQINRDIDAQKAELGKKENLLSANLKQFGNLKDATQMTAAMQMDIVGNKLKMAAAQAMDPLAKARALQAAGKLDQEAAGLQAQVAMRRTMTGGALAGGTPDSPGLGQTIQALRQMNPAMAKSLEERYVPTVGLATVPVPQAARDTIVAKQQLQSMSTDFYNWAKEHSGSLDPATVNAGKTKAAELQSLYRNSINGGVFKKGEQEFIDQIVDSDPTKFFNSVRVLPKLQEVMNSNQQQLRTLKRGFGLPATQINENPPVVKQK